MPLSDKIAAAVLSAVSVLLIIVALLSLRWGLVEDAPILMYMAYLMDHFHQVPYRDFFDINLPGTYVFNILIGRLFGYTDFGMRCGDLVYLLATLVATWLFMKPFGGKAAWCSAVLFGLVYLGFGHAVSLEREYILIFPMVLAIWILASASLPNEFLEACWLASSSACVQPSSPRPLWFCPCLWSFTFEPSKSAMVRLDLPILADSWSRHR